MAVINESIRDYLEFLDYKRCEAFFTDLFKDYNKKFSIQQMPKGCYIDAKMQVICNDHLKKYTIEIKNREEEYNQQCYPNFLLKVSKYINMKKATKTDEKMLLLYILDNKTCFLFDMAKFDFNKIEMRNVILKKIQYTAKEEAMMTEEERQNNIEITPCYLIPKSKAIIIKDLDPDIALKYKPDHNKIFN